MFKNRYSGFSLTKYRRFITSSVGFTFLVVGTTGMIFKFWFKNHTLEGIHGWLGTAMVAAAILHISQNLRPIQNYLRDVRVLSLLAPVVIAIVLIVATQKEDTGVNPKLVVRKLSHGSLNHVSQAFGKDVDSVVRAMRADGLSVESAMDSLDSLAGTNKVPIEKLMIYFIR